MNISVTNEEVIRYIKKEIFKAAPQFRQWIEGSSLFHAIVTDANIQGLLVIHEPDGERWELQLNGYQIYKVEDLPIELIQRFYKHYPHNIIAKDQIKLLTDASYRDIHKKAI